MPRWRSVNEAAVRYRPKVQGQGMNPTEMVSEDEMGLLLQLARNAIQTTVQKGRKLPVVEPLSPLLREKRGVFVTLWMEGELRGCIGFPYPVRPLAEAVQEA